MNFAMIFTSFIKICQLVLGLLFVIAGFSKVLRPDEFAIILANYRLIPTQYIGIISILLPWIEFVAGSLLLLNIYRKKAVIVISSLLIIFILAISINLIKGIDFDCGCFSPIPSDTNENKLVWIFRDIVMFSMGLLIILFDKRFEKSKIR